MDRKPDEEDASRRSWINNTIAGDLLIFYVTAIAAGLLAIWIASPLP